MRGCLAPCFRICPQATPAWTQPPQRGWADAYHSAKSEDSVTHVDNGKKRLNHKETRRLSIVEVPRHVPDCIRRGKAPLSGGPVTAWPKGRPKSLRNEISAAREVNGCAELTCGDM
jgi:hypothetical protein